MTPEQEAALNRLTTAGLFYETDEDEPGLERSLNLNDAFFWACADCEYVDDDALLVVDRLFFAYGWCGILYWANEKRGEGRVEFEDVNRHIDFVRAEEMIRREVPRSTTRAYHKASYTLPSQA